MLPLLAVILSGFVVAFAAAAALTPLVRRLALHKGWVDKPDGVRKLHPEPIPAIGGLAVAGGIAIAMGYVFGLQHVLPVSLELPPAIFWVGAAVLVASGLYDDVRGLGFKGKFVIQIAVAYALLHEGYRLDITPLPFVGDDPFNEALYTIPLTMIWIVGITNAVNLIDGVDGLAAGIGFIAFTCLSLVLAIQGEVGLVLVGVVYAGAFASFLLFNFNPATIFMGDAGSLFLGYSLAVFSLEGRAHTDPVLALLIPGIVLGLPVLDTALAIVRRASNRQGIFAPDHDHIHHRLVRWGGPRRAVLRLYAAATGFGTAAVLISLSEPWAAYLILGAVCLAALAGVSKLPYSPPKIESVSPKDIDASAAQADAPTGHAADALASSEVPSPPDRAPRDWPGNAPPPSGDGLPESQVRYRLSYD